MNYVEKFFDGVQSVLNVNAATFSGACDIIVVRRPDGSLHSTPFHVRFGKLKLISSREKTIVISINGQVIEGLTMKLGSAGEAYFVVESEEQIPPFLQMSPVGSPPDSDFEDKELPDDIEFDENVPLTDQLEEMIKSSSSPTETSPMPITLSASSPAVPMPRASPEGEKKQRKNWAWGWRGWRKKDELPVIEKDPEEWKEQKSHIKESYLAMQQQHDQIQQELEERKPGQDTIIQGKDTAPSLTQLVTPAVGDVPKVGSWKNPFKLFGIFKRKDKNAGSKTSMEIDRQQALTESQESQMLSDSQEVFQMDEEHSGSQLDSSTLNPSLYHSTVSQLDSSTVVDHNDGEPSIAQQQKTSEKDPSAEEHAESSQNEDKSHANVENSSEQQPHEDAQDDHLNDSQEHHMKVELSSNVSEEQLNELKEKIEDMEGDILQTQYEHEHPESESGDIHKIAGVKYLEVTPRGSPIQSARGSTNIFDKYKIQDKKVNPKFMKTMFDKEVHGAGTDLAEDVDTKLHPKININNVNINNVDPADEEISEEKMRYVDSIINKVTTAHRASPSLPRKESTEDLQRLHEEKSGSDTHTENNTENNVNTKKSDNIDIKKDEIHQHESRSVSPEKDTKLDWSSLKFNDLQIEISNCGNIIFEPPVNEDEKKMEQIFDENLVSYEQFSTNPQMLFKSNMAFRIQNKIFPWQVAGPMLISLLAFKRPPDVNAMANVMYDAQSEPSSSKSSTAPTPSIEKKGVLLDPTNPQKKRFSWGSFFKWGKKGENGAPIAKTFLRSLKPTSEQLAKLNLKPGANTITFSVTSRFQGTKEISASIFLWDSNVKVCISDIDGTITKSDVFGQILPQFGKDWSHGGVVKFFNNIKNNGYEMLYLTARAIGQADITKNYLRSLDHEGATLPIGPILMSPDRLFSSLNREVIIRKPHKFKIACLTDILSLFPEGAKPFYAGFGNRATDAISYVAVGVPEAKIFTINEFSEISYACSMYTRTYIKLNELVDPMFPPINGAGSVAEEFNDFQYWERPQYKLEDIEAEILRK